jgi:hypothetical protein
MIRRSIHRVLYAPWPQRWLVDVLALALGTAVLPRIGEGLHVHSAPGFALMLVTSTAALLAANWALLSPARTKQAKSYVSGAETPADVPAASAAPKL